VGTTITVDALYLDGGGENERVSSTGVGPINNLNDAPTGSVIIDNMSPAEGATLTASNTLADEDGLSGSISYQWHKDGVVIGGATGNTYTVGAGDVGGEISVQATYIDDLGNPENIFSGNTAAVTNVNNSPTGSVTISGTPSEGQVLSASNTLADLDGLGVISYQWQRDGTDIAGEIGGAYTLTQADVGTTITVVASYTDAQSTTEQVSSAGVGPIINLNDAPTGSVMISGTPTEDSTLTASNTLADEDGLGTIAYQWQRNGSDISGETGSTYTLTQADVGATITVDALYLDGGGTNERVSSTGVGPINNLNDAPTGLVTISGTPTEDSTLTAANTLADEDGLGAVSYQWQRNGSDITGETGSTYTLTQADVGSTITVEASYTDAQSTSEQVTSAGVGPINNLNDAPSGLVTISGTPTEDGTLTAANTLADEDGMGTVSYQWQRNGSDITGETGSTYTLAQADVGATITVDALYLDGGGTNERFSSAGVGPINNLNDAPTGSVIIDNMSPAVGATLNASNTLADEDGLSGPISYQWYKDGMAIGGATSNTYSVGAGDVGGAISVQASYTDDLGNSESVFSGATAAVTNFNNSPTGFVTISGTPTEQQILAASNTLADLDGMGAISYQWQRNGSDIIGETSSTYALTQADVGATITVDALYLDGGGTNERVGSAGVGPINNLNDAPTGSVTISGTPTEDSTLTAANTLADEDGLGTITYQWQRNGSDITGETGATYTLTQADVGATITVDALYLDGGGTNERVSSAGVGPINNLNDSHTGTVTIGGTPMEGSTLIAANTLVDEDGLGAISYQWQRNGSDIAGETGSTYTLTQSDVNSTVTVVASYADEFGNAASVSSDAIGPVENVNDAPSGDVLIDNVAPVKGDMLIAHALLDDEDGMGSIGFQWQRDGVDIVGANESSYITSDKDVGGTLTVVAHYTDDFGTAEQVASATTAVVADLDAPAPEPLPEPAPEPEPEPLPEPAPDPAPTPEPVPAPEPEPAVDSEQDTPPIRTLPDPPASSPGPEGSLTDEDFEPDGNTLDSPASGSEEFGDLFVLAAGNGSPDSGDSSSDITFSGGVRGGAVAPTENPVSTESLAEQIVQILREDEEIANIAEIVASGSTDTAAIREIVDIAEKRSVSEMILEASREEIELSHVNSVLNSHALWKAIGAMNEELDDGGRRFEEEGERLVVRVASTTSVGLVAAFTAYVLRGSALLASLISASPLWSVYDPLPVLRDPEELKKSRFRIRKAKKPRSETSDSEHVESMFG
jgi:uncharacterized protein (UPF0303 family)